MIDYILIAIILVIVAAAAFYVYKAKKKRKEMYWVSGWLFGMQCKKEWFPLQLRRA